MGSFNEWLNLHVNRQRNISYDLTHLCSNVQKSLVLTKITIQRFLKILNDWIRLLKTHYIWKYDFLYNKKMLIVGSFDKSKFATFFIWTNFEGKIT